MKFDDVQKLRNLCLENAEDLVKSARQLNGKNVAHVQYHLAALALEEIGKSSLIEMQFFANQRVGDDNLEVGSLESHVKKLFWAFWGPSFGNQRITKQQIDDFLQFSEVMGLTPVIATRFNREGWLFLNPKQLEDSGVNWVVNLKKAKVEGKRFSQFFENRAEDII